MYFVTMEVSQAIETNKKVGRIGSMVADLVTQQQTISKAELEAIMKIGESTLQPYNRIEADDHHHGDRDHRRDDAEGAGGVVAQAGQRRLQRRPRPRDTITTVPATLKIKGTFLVRVESKLAYKPVITWAADSKSRSA